MVKYCQSCAMPIVSRMSLSFNKDGSYNYDFCKSCYKFGKLKSEL